MCALLKPMMELLIMRPTQKTCGGSTAAGSKMRAMKNILKENPNPKQECLDFCFDTQIERFSRTLQGFVFCNIRFQEDVYVRCS